MLTDKAAITLTRAFVDALYRTMDAKSHEERAALAAAALGCIAGEVTLLHGGKRAALILQALAESSEKAEAELAEWVKAKSTFTA